MSTKSTYDFSSEYVLDVKDSDYEFNRFNKCELENTVNVQKLMVVTDSYSSWENAVNPMLAALVDESDIYCFIVSPCWKADTKIVSYFSLGKMLSKEYKIGPLPFLFETKVASINGVVFYGLVKLTKSNAKNIFKLLSSYDNGVLFSNSSIKNSYLNEFANELAVRAVPIKSKTLVFNIVEAINVILDNGMDAIFPYAWEETGEYHLDIFSRNG